MTDESPSTPGSLRAYLDGPRPWDRVERVLDVVGWAFAHDGAPVRVDIFLNDLVMATTPADELRPDVSAAFGEPQSVHSGFRVAIPRDHIKQSLGIASDTGAPDQLKCRVELVVDESRTTLAEVPVEWIADDALDRTRSDYKSVWNDVARTADEARISVAGYTDQSEWERTGQASTEMLFHNLKLGPNDAVMEIGCGSGRIAHFLAPRVRKWIGGDVSKRMLDHAKSELAHVPNVEFRELNGSDLRGVDDSSLDAIYCTVVFMHLDEWDRFRYVREMFRVLKPGGRMYIDNYNLLSDEGWKFFLETAAIDPQNRPANISKSSTPQELRNYVARSGFVDINVQGSLDALFVAATGTKPFPEESVAVAK